MLIDSTDKNDKILLGLLSYTYSEESGTLDDLKSDLETYRSKPDYRIFLYKTAGSDNYIGLIAAEIRKNEVESTAKPSMTINIEKVALLPSFRHEGIGFKMFKELKDKYPNATIIGSLENADLILKWTRQYNQLG